jgi:hypothetical protein
MTALTDVLALIDVRARDVDPDHDPYGSNDAGVVEFDGYGQPFVWVPDPGGTGKVGHRVYGICEVRLDDEEPIKIPILIDRQGHTLRDHYAYNGGGREWNDHAVALSWLLGELGAP